MTYYEDTAAERAARGASLLDEKVPGWTERIDVEWLAIYDPARCVLGQLYAGQFTPYSVGLSALFGADRSDQEYTHGFDTFGGIHEGYPGGALTDAWRDEIKRRRGV